MTYLSTGAEEYLLTNLNVSNVDAKYLAGKGKQRGSRECAV